MTTFTRTKIRLHADHVGSLLRPQTIKDARTKLWDQGELARFGQATPPAGLKAAEDVEITEAVNSGAP